MEPAVVLLLGSGCVTHFNSINELNEMLLPNLHVAS